MAVVRNTGTLPDGTPVPRFKVEIRLVKVDGGAFRSDNTQLVGVTQLQADSKGFWSVTLTANSTITPAGTYYEVREYIDPRNPEVSRVIVPASGGPYDLRTVLAAPVPAVQGWTPLKGDPGLIVLSATAPVPPGTPAGTVIVRTAT